MVSYTKSKYNRSYSSGYKQIHISKILVKSEKNEKREGAGALSIADYNTRNKIGIARMHLVHGAKQAASIQCMSHMSCMQVYQSKRNSLILSKAIL
jgi:hypothetical protein